MQKKDWIISAVIIVVLYSGFLYINFIMSVSYGRAFNSEREALGVPRIGPGLSIVKNAKDSSYWYNPSENVPRHDFKELNIHNGNLIIERDDFILYQDEKTVTLTSYYHYDDACFNIYLEVEKGHLGEAISCDDANRLLQENGLPVLKYCKPCEKK